MAKWITNSDEEVKITAGELGWGKVVALSMGALFALTATKEEKPFLKTLAVLGLVLGACAYIAKNATVRIGWSMDDDCDCDCAGGDFCDCDDDCDCGDDCACKAKDKEAEDLAD